jgi:hypothetical protein
MIRLGRLVSWACDTAGNGKIASNERPRRRERRAIEDGSDYPQPKFGDASAFEGIKDDMRGGFDSGIFSNCRVNTGN